MTKNLLRSMDEDKLIIYLYFGVCFLFVIALGIFIHYFGLPEGCTSGYCPF